ncbi:MAG: hypothetical protein Q7R94_02905 [bacterium]|nr:hypothetical protein [bacterium]
MKNNNPQIDKWGKLAKRFALALLLVIAAFIVMFVFAVWRQLQTNQSSAPWIDYVGNSLFVVGAVALVGLLFSKIALFIAKRRAPKENSGNVIKAEEVQLVGWRAHKKLIIYGGIILMLVIVFLFGSQPESCVDAGCFVAAANNGKAAKFQQTDEAGIEWSYQIKGGLGSGQTFTKTLLRLDDKELPQIKEFLEGKSMTCKLSGAFDERLVTTLIYGVGDNCSGELKENLGQLLFLL